MRPAKTLAFLLAVLAISMLFVLPATESESAVSEGDVGLVTNDVRLEISAGSSDHFIVGVVNSLPHIDNNLDNHRMISISFISGPDITVSAADGDRDFILGGQEYRPITVSVDVDRYAAADTYRIGLVLKISGMEPDSAVITTAPVQVDLAVESHLSSGNAFNKILGIFSNPLPEPFNSPLATAVISFFLWVIIGVLAMLAVLPLLIHVVARNHKEEGEKLKEGIRTLIPIVLILYAFDGSLRVFGASEEIIGSVGSWFAVFYIIMGALIAWRIYVIFVQYTSSKLSKNKRIDQRDMDIEPLLRLLGKLTISVMAVAFIMSAWGFNLTVIITSAGIVSLGITLGAQNILNQFFSGMVLLLTRPFKSGDLVKIGGESTIYKVSGVNIMNTVFENWDNEETVIMPNNTVSSSTIVNLTGDGLIYKITVYMNIAYDDDIDLARSLMEQVAMEHPNVIVNGSVDLPSTRVTAFLDSSIELRLTSFVYDFNDSGKIGGELRESVFKLFKKNGISVPFPQMDVHLNVVQKEDHT